MMCARDIRFASLRLLLAALIALAGLAGARMQGQMGAEVALASALGGGVLCSGAVQQDAGDKQPFAAHAECLSCNLPVAALLPSVQFAAPARSFLAVETAFRASIAFTSVVFAYRSRAPPLAV